MKRLFRFAAAVQEFCEAQGWKFCFIGGVAAQAWTETRGTKDADLTPATSLLPALFTGASCCISGLGMGLAVKDLPQMTQSALTRSVAGLFVISAAVSLLTYL